MKMSKRYENNIMSHELFLTTIRASLMIFENTCGVILLKDFRTPTLMTAGYITMERMVSKCCSQVFPGRKR